MTDEFEEMMKKMFNMTGAAAGQKELSEADKAKLKETMNKMLSGLGGLGESGINPADVSSIMDAILGGAVAAAKDNKEAPKAEKKAEPKAAEKTEPKAEKKETPDIDHAKIAEQMAKMSKMFSGMKVEAPEKEEKKAEPKAEKKAACDEDKINEQLKTLNELLTGLNKLTEKLDEMQKEEEKTDKKETASPFGCGAFDAETMKKMAEMFSGKAAPKAEKKAADCAELFGFDEKTIREYMEKMFGTAAKKAEPKDETVNIEAMLSGLLGGCGCGEHKSKRGMADFGEMMSALMNSECGCCGERKPKSEFRGRGNIGAILESLLEELEDVEECQCCCHEEEEDEDFEIDIDELREASVKLAVALGVDEKKAEELFDSIFECFECDCEEEEEEYEEGAEAAFKAFVKKYYPKATYFGFEVEYGDGKEFSVEYTE